jgi:hypothetical protein
MTVQFVVYLTTVFQLQKLWCQMKWEHDYEWWINRNLKGGSCNLFQDVISDICLTVSNPAKILLGTSQMQVWSLTSIPTYSAPCINGRLEYNLGIWYIINVHDISSYCFSWFSHCYRLITHARNIVRTWMVSVVYWYVSICSQHMMDSWLKQYTLINTTCSFVW